MVIDHTCRAYRGLRQLLPEGDRHNGAFYYSQEIVRNIIPRVRTDRDWVTVNIPHDGRSVVFIHSNAKPEVYSWCAGQDCILVCGVPGTMGRVEAFGKPVYLPLSVDLGYVMRFEAEKDREVAFFGRPSKSCGVPEGVPVIGGLPRDAMLREMARTRKAYAVGRCAIEAKALGCEVLPYDPRYPDPSMWQVLDNRDAAFILQAEIDRIDGRRA